MNKLISVAFASLLAAAGSAETLVVEKGEMVSPSGELTVTSFDVHGTLNVSGATKASPCILTADPPNTLKMYLGSAVGDEALLNIGDYGAIKGGIFVIGENGGTGRIVVGGKRTNDRTDEIWNGSDAHRNGAHVIISSNAVATAGSQTIDFLQLNEGASFGGGTTYGGAARVINQNKTYAARILFNGGRYCVYNGGCTYLFTSASNTQYPGDIASGWGGKSIVLEGVNGHDVKVFLINGGGFWPGYGSVIVKGDCDMVFEGVPTEVKYAPRMFLNGVFSWQQSGDVILKNSFGISCQGGNVLPSGAATGSLVLAGDKPECALLLNGHSQKLNGLVVTGAAAEVNASADSTLTFGTGDTDGVLAVPRLTGAGTVRCVKTGTGTLTVTNTPTLAQLTVNGGTASFERTDCTIDDLTLGANGALIVKGCTLTVRRLVHFSNDITCIDGGKLVVGIPGETNDYLAHETLGCRLLKTGGGLVVLHNTSVIADDIHVAAGTLGFATTGTTNHWLRFSFSKMYSGNGFELSEVLVMNAGGQRIDGGGITVGLGSAVVDAAADVAWKDMSPKSVWANDPSWLLNEPVNGYRDRTPSALFDGQSWTRLRYSTLPTAGNPKVIVVRLPASANDVLQYNFRNGYSTQTEPTDWTLETSPDGVNWTLPNAWVGQVPATTTQGFYNGGVHYQILAGRSGSPGLSPTANVQVDQGATLDFGGVAARQTLANLTVDLALGGGTIKNAKLAASGTIDIVNATGPKAPKGELPLVFEDCETSGALDWTVKVNGVVTPKRLLSWQNGRLFLSPVGMTILIR